MARIPLGKVDFGPTDSEVDTRRSVLPPALGVTGSNAQMPSGQGIFFFGWLVAFGGTGALPEKKS